MPHREFSGEELTEAERRKLREIIESDERMAWLAAFARRTAAWVAAILGAIWLAWDTFVKIVRSAVE